MKQIITAAIIAVFACLWVNSVFAYECSGLPEWNRNTTYQIDAIVQYHGSAYAATAAATSQDRPGHGDPWRSLGSCDTDGGDGGDGGGCSDCDASTLQPLSIYGVWHCGNHYCDWSIVRDTSPDGEFDQANHWIIDRGDVNHSPSVNLVVL